MKARNKVRDLNNIGHTPGTPRKSQGRPYTPPPEEAFLTPGERGRPEREDEDDRPRREREFKSRERPSN